MFDQEKIGNFIARKRKEKGLTQKDVATSLGITDRAVSKWERGLSLPDSSIMIDLCSMLEISVNELLSGEEIEDGEREKENNLILEMKRMEEDANRRLLALETLLGIISTLSFLALFPLSVYFIYDINKTLSILLSVLSFLIFFLGLFFALKIEKDAGYYECPNCHEKYIPSFYQVLAAPHIFRSRRLKCPKCNKRGWHKKVLS